MRTHYVAYQFVKNIGRLFSKKKEYLIETEARWVEGNRVEKKYRLKSYIWAELW